MENNIDPTILAKFKAKAPKELTAAELTNEFMAGYTEGNALRMCKIFLQERRISGQRYKDVMNFISIQTTGKPLRFSDD